MKKLFAAALTLVLLCAALPAWAAGDPLQGIWDPLLGTWRMNRYCVDGTIYNNPAAAGSQKSVEFLGDHTALVTINGTVYGATWEQEGVFVHLLYDDGDKAEFIAEPDMLIYATGNQVQHFSKGEARTQAQAQPQTQPQATATPKPATPAIVGTWKWQAPKGVATLTIRADGTATLSMGGRNFNLEWKLSGSKLTLSNQDMVMTGTYTSSAIHLGFSGLDMKFTR